MTPADVILVFVIVLAIGGAIYFHISDRKDHETAL